MRMPKRRLGADGPEVGAIGFGAMSFAGFFGDADDDTSLETLGAALEAGIDFWDTSNLYGMGRSERVIGRFLAEIGGDAKIATKVGIVPKPQRHFRNDEDHIRSELDASLKRLNRDKVELYYIHRREKERPVEEVAETMGKLIQEGLIDAWGLSEVAPSSVSRAHSVVPLTAVQNEYSLWTRLPELGVLQTCEALGITFVPFSPIARGALGSTDLNPASFADTDFRKSNPRFAEPNWSANMERIKAFRALAEARNVAAPALALAWVLSRSETLIPIPGTRTKDHLAEWLPAIEIELTSADLEEIENILPAGWAWGDRYSDAQSFGTERYC